VGGSWAGSCHRVGEAGRADRVEKLHGRELADRRGGSGRARRQTNRMPRGAHRLGPRSELVAVARVQENEPPPAYPTVENLMIRSTIHDLTV